MSTNLNNGNVGTSLEDATKAEISALELNGIAARTLLEEEKATLENQRGLLVKERNKIEDVRVNLQSREELARSDLQRTEALLARGYVTAPNLDNKRSELLAAQQASLQNEVSLHAVLRQLDEIDSRIRSVPARLAELLSQRSAQNATLKQKLTQVKAQSSETIIAPVSGTVAAIASEIGQTLDPSGVVAVLTPAGSELQAELFVPSRAIGFVHVGQEVALQYQAFPYQRYGSGKGRITAVSKTVIAPTDISGGTSVQEPVFRVKVSLADQSIQAYGDAIKLQPGMLLNANIVLERRNLLKLFFDPIFAIRGRA